MNIIVVKPASIMVVDNRFHDSNGLIPFVTDVRTCKENVGVGRSYTMESFILALRQTAKERGRKAFTKNELDDFRRIIEEP